MSDIAIKVEHLSKMYRLGVINNGTLFRDIQTWIALKRGREDPHSKIGENKYNNDKDHFWALKDINFELKKGDRLGIIGKNGAGKSTLLKIISRITTPTEGLVKINGRVASLLEVGTGFHRELTGRENIYLNGAILGMKKRQIDKKLDEIVDFSGIEQHIDTPIKRYSSGMFVRLAFAVAAHLDADILIADEVLAVGDAEFQKKALGKMEELSTGQGRTVLFVSHNMGAVKNLCNCGIVLERGNIKNYNNNIDKVVSEYLGNLSKERTTKWYNNGEHNNADLTPISLEILEDNGSEIKDNISAGKEYYIKLSLNIQKINPDYLIILVFSTIENDILFITSPNDYGNSMKQNLGINNLFCKTPKNFFNTREYIVSLGLAIHNVKWIVYPFENAVSIKMNVITSKTGKNLTLIAPKLKWSKNEY